MKQSSCDGSAQRRKYRLGLIEKKKNMDRKDKAQVRDISKKIKRRIRGNERSKRREKVLNILDEFKGIGSIASTRKNSHEAYEKQIGKHRSNEERYCQRIRGILQRSTHIRTMKE